MGDGCGCFVWTLLIVIVVVMMSASVAVVAISVGFALAAGLVWLISWIGFVIGRVLKQRSAENSNPSRGSDRQA